MSDPHPLGAGGTATGCFAGLFFRRFLSRLLAPLELWGPWFVFPLVLFSIPLLSSSTALGSPGASASPSPSPGDSASSLCLQAIHHVESHTDLPKGLLHAIARVESDLWPWAIQANNKTHRPPTKEAAKKLVLSLLGQGVKNVDVGCMQVNLKAHAIDLDNALDPHENVAYAANYLTKLRRKSPNHFIFAANYHSRTPHHHTLYKRKLLRAWLRHLKGILSNHGKTGHHPPMPGPQETSRLSYNGPGRTPLKAEEVFKGTTALPKNLYISYRKDAF